MKTYSTILLSTLFILTAFAWSGSTMAAAPANDNLVNVQEVTFTDTTTTISANNIQATRESGEPIHFNANYPGTKSVWYRWAAGSSFALQLKLTSDFQSLISVYKSSSHSPAFSDLTRVSSTTESAFDYQSMNLRFFAEAGTTYYIAIDCNNINQAVTEGPFQLEFIRGRFRYSTNFSSADEPATMMVYRPSDGVWYALSYWSSSSPNYSSWGLSGDAPLPADYDGSGDADLCITRNQGGLKYWHMNPQSGSLDMSISQWGLASDKAVTGDFDRDGRADLTVIRQTATGLQWYVLSSASGDLRLYRFGINTDTPVVGDFDGDGATDIAVTRLSGGALTWYILKSGFTAQGNPTFNSVDVIPFGSTGDVVSAEDFDGDGRTDIAVFRPQQGTWYIIRSGTGQIQVTQFGLPGDKPQAADYDGDGIADLTVIRPGDSIWYIWLSRSNTVYARPWGKATDVPVTSLNSLIN